MKKMFRIVLIFLCPLYMSARPKPRPEKEGNDSTLMFKKRVLESMEMDILTSLYSQNGDHASVSGGVGSEKLTDFATSIDLQVPLNEDDILTVNGTISAYTSASSSNVNPWDGGGGSPWVASSGASRGDVWGHGDVGYSHASDDRNKLYSANVNFAVETDYTSFGFGGDYTQQLNHKNTAISLGVKLYLDSWNPQDPIELRQYRNSGGDLYSGVFWGQNIYNSQGQLTDKNGPNTWMPLHNYFMDVTNRNTYTMSLSISQIITKRMQVAVFTDLTYQSGWLANPMQRVYFADRENYYMGNPASIPNYTSPQNTDVFQLADDIERLPHARFKIPVGARLNYYINQYLVLNAYYRYYQDNWGITSNTLNFELPIKVGSNFTLYPNFRYYDQTQASYFAPYNQHLTTEEFYTSDYDLAEFTAMQYSFGIKYTDIFAEKHIWIAGLKNLSLDVGYYQRTNNLNAFIVTVGAKFVLDKITTNEMFGNNSLW